jgi:hypothetical protein
MVAPEYSAIALSMLSRSSAVVNDAPMKFGDARNRFTPRRTGSPGGGALSTPNGPGATTVIRSSLGKMIVVIVPLPDGMSVNHLT